MEWGSEKASERQNKLAISNQKLDNFYIAYLDWKWFEEDYSKVIISKFLKFACKIKSFIFAYLFTLY